jgi:Fe-S cluster biogenesis protein NfuA
MDQQIAIQAQILSTSTCQFTVDRDVYAGVVNFRSREDAAGSPLAEKLFAIPGITSVLISRRVVKIVKEGLDEWMPIAKQIGGILRAQLQSGAPGISETLVQANANDSDMYDRIVTLIDQQINPAVAQHGGSVSLVDVKDAVVYLQLGGGCQGCGMATATLRQGIEQMIRRSIPEVANIVDVTDHASGENPYYTASAK